MKMRKTGMILATMWLGIGIANGAHVSIDFARKIADGFLMNSLSQTLPCREGGANGGRRMAKDERHGRSVKAAMPNVLDDQQFYIFETENGGFIIIAGEDCAHPVLAYGDKAFPGMSNGEGGGMKGRSVPENVRRWLEGYNYSIRAAVSDGYTTPQEVQAEWAALATGAAVEATPVVEPLLQTTWNQNAEYLNWATYNYYTPVYVYTYEGVDYECHVPVGCVATAMAQVMNYWQWPKQGTGSHSYTHTEYGVQSADFGATSYDWAHMPSALNGETSTDTEIEAVAQLMYHCGVATNMNYGEKGSGTQTVIYGKYDGYSPAEFAFASYFGYANTSESYSRSDFPDTESWTSMLKEELDARRPIMYAGTGEDPQAGGHSFVCCGYDSEDRFYFNFGWGGYYDGYYLCDAVKPSDSGTGGNGSSDYSYNQDVIVGLRPAANEAELSYDFALRLYCDDDDHAVYAPQLDKDSLWYLGEDLTATIVIANYDTLTYNSVVALQVIDEEGRVIATSESVNVNIEDFSYYETSITLKSGISLCPGQYHLQPVYRNAGGGWSPIEARHYWNELAFTVYYWNNLFAYKSDATVKPNPLVEGAQGIVSINIANVRDTAISGIFYASLYSPDDEFVQDIGYVDLSDSPLGSYYYQSFTFSGTITAAPGTYTLLLSYYENGSRIVVGCDGGKAVTHVDVVSAEDAPDYYSLSVNAFEPMNTESQRPLAEGDKFGAYIDIANSGTIDYQGYIIVALFDAKGNQLAYSRYNATIGAQDRLAGFVKIDTSLIAGNYYSGLYYYNAETETYMRITEGESPSWITFTIDSYPESIANTEEGSVRIYPNPVVDALHIDGTEATQWSLYTISGMLVGQQTNSRVILIPMSNLPAGEYIFRMTDSQGETSVHRILKQ